MDILNHFPAAQERRHFVKKLFPAVQDTNTHWGHHFMAGKCHKIGAKFLHVHPHMRDALCTVYHNNCTYGMGLVRNFPHRINRAEHIGNVRYGNKLCFLCDFRVDFLFRKMSLCIRIKIYKLCAFRLRDHLPWDKVAVMFAHGQGNLVVFLQKSQAIAVSDKVKGLACISRENDFAVFFRTNKLCNRAACPLIALSSLHAKLIKAAVWIRVLRTVKLIHRMDNLQGALRRCSIVKVNQAFAVHRLIQDRKILSPRVQTSSASLSHSP